MAHLRSRPILAAAAAVVIAASVVLALVDAGIAIGAASRSPALAAATADTSDTADPAVIGDIDALLAADVTADPQPAAGASAAPRKNTVAIAGLRRLAAARRLVHGTVVVDLPKFGGLTTIQLDHGTISAVSASSVTVTETGSAPVTVRLGDATRVRRHGARAAVADLATGDDVFVLSRVEPSGAEAYLVVVSKS